MARRSGGRWPGPLCFQPIAHKPHAFVALFWMHSGQLPFSLLPTAANALGRHLKKGAAGSSSQTQVRCCCLAGAWRALGFGLIRWAP